MSWLRLRRQLPRLPLQLAAVAGLTASLRFAVAPPRPGGLSHPAAKPVDVTAEGFASLFARAYLGWQQDDPEARRQALEPFAGSALGSAAGMQMPQRGSQQVLFVQPVQEREGPAGIHDYTFAVEVDPGGLLYVGVPVLQRPDGAVALASYPAFVGAPASTPAEAVIGTGGEVEDHDLKTVVERVLRNYLAPAPSELAADLAPGAHVSTPAQGLSVELLQSLTWTPDGGQAVVAQVLAQATDGARFTLDYEIGVEQAAGRWEVTAIQAAGAF